MLCIPKEPKGSLVLSVKIGVSRWELSGLSQQSYTKVSNNWASYLGVFLGATL